jgi:hypothetical protein
MKRLAPWAWVVVLGTALALSWWSLDALALHFGMPKLLAAMVSATFDGAALVAADLALRRAVQADSAAAVKLLMIAAVGLSAWLNAEHAMLLGYPLVGRVLFAAPSVLGGWLFELQLGGLHRDRLHELGRVTQPLPRFGLLVWLFHPWAALKHLSRMAASRLRSVPVTVMDWEGAAVRVHELAGASDEIYARPVILAAPVEVEDDRAGSEASELDECIAEDAGEEVRTQRKAGRSPVPDELYLVKLRELVGEAGGVVPSIREVARQLSIGQGRARRLVGLLGEGHDGSKSGLSGAPCAVSGRTQRHCLRGTYRSSNAARARVSI